VGRRSRKGLRNKRIVQAYLSERNTAPSVSKPDHGSDVPSVAQAVMQEGRPHWGAHAFSYQVRESVRCLCPDAPLVSSNILVRD